MRNSIRYSVRNSVSCRVPIAAALFWSNSHRSPTAARSRLKTSSHGSFRGRFLLGSRLDPQAQQQLGETLHAGPPQTFVLRRFLESGYHRAAFLIVPPKLRFKSFNCNLFIGSLFRGTLKLSQPEVSLVWMPLQIIKDSLLAPVQAHFATVPADFGKTTAKPALAEGRHFTGLCN